MINNEFKIEKQSLNDKLLEWEMRIRHFKMIQKELKSNRCCVISLRVIIGGIKDETDVVIVKLNWSFKKYNQN